jgi:hypothetical protein
MPEHFGLVPLIQYGSKSQIHVRDQEERPLCGFTGRDTPNLSSGYLKQATCEACVKIAKQDPVRPEYKTQT